MVIHIFIKFGADWLIYVDARVLTVAKHSNFSNSRADNSSQSGLFKSILQFVSDPMFINIFTRLLTKFGADWLIFVGAQV